MTIGMAAREAALQMLYALDLDRGSQSVREVEHWYRKAHPLEPAETARAKALVEAVEAQKETIVGLIAKHAIGWRLERMSVVDRCVLKIATAELLQSEGASRREAIEAAVRLARTFSQPQAANFVKGLLEAIARELTSKPEGVAENGAEVTSHGT